VRAICDLYAQATTLHEGGTHLVSCDEKTGIQALERARTTLPLRPGLVERIEYEYVRHGTLCLIANLNVATGRVENPTIGLTRSEEDFAAHIDLGAAIGVDLELPRRAWPIITQQVVRLDALLRERNGSESEKVSPEQPQLALAELMKEQDPQRRPRRRGAAGRCARDPPEGVIPPTGRLAERFRATCSIPVSLRGPRSVGLDGGVGSNVTPLLRRAGHRGTGAHA
jgi:hypothetical protein